MRYLVFASLVAAAAAQAQQDTTHKHIDTTQHRLATVVVNGTRLSNVDERTPSQIEELNLTKAPIPGPELITDALLRQPGVTLYDDQGTRLQPELEIRGFSTSSVVGTPQGIGVFLNGLRVNEPDAQEVNFDLIPSAALETTTLDRGSNVLFGRNSLGGTLLMTTKRGGDRPELTGQVGVGSWGGELATVTAGGKVDGIDGYIAASGENEVGWKNVSSSNTRNIFATIGHQWGTTHDNGDIALDVLYGHDRMYEVGSLPDAYAHVDPRYDYSSGDFFHPELFSIDVRGNGELGGGIIRGNVFGRRNDIEQFNGNSPPPNTDGFTKNQSAGGALEWTRPVYIEKVPIGLTVGTEYAREEAQIRLYNVDAGPTVETTQATINQDIAAAYGQAVITLMPGLDVTGGVRYDYVHIPFRDGLDSANDGNSTYNHVAGEVGASYQATDWFKVYAAFKQGFRAPAPLELACASPVAPCSLPSALGADPTLKPVTTNDYEGGIDLTLTKRTFFDADAFWTDVFNDIVFASPNRIQTYFLNAPKTRRAGVETSGQIGLPLGFYFTGSYSYVAATFQSVVSISSADPNQVPTQPGDIMPTSPLHRAMVGLGLTRLLGPVLFDGEFNIRGYSSQYYRGDESNIEPQIPGYTVAEFRGHVDWNRFSVACDIDNLFNRTFYTFGILAQNSLIPIYSQVPLADNDSPITHFVVPALPRRVVVTFTVHY
jgi:iron complex outermembrane recepter protein